MGFWELMIKKDDCILYSIDFLLSLKSKFDFKYRKVVNQNKGLIPVTGNRIFVILNGPSIKEQNLEKLEGEDAVFVNRGFKHPAYATIKPKFHVFVDPKMVTGEWDLEWLDEIHEMSPDTIFVFPAAWYFIPKFAPYINKYKIYWLLSSGKCHCTGVGGACFDFAYRLGYKEIYFTGWEATGLAHELLKTTSHFYGVNEENALKNSADYSRDLYMMSRHLNDLINLSKKYKRKGVRVVNLTIGGLLDMFERKSFDSVI